MLPPGPYELDGLLKGDGLTTPRGMQWVISCHDGADQQLGASDDFAGTFDWHSFAVPFIVPATGCLAQTLSLELDTRSPLDQQVVGTFRSDAIAIKRSDVAAAGN